ncbi:MAG: Alanine--glyoxylate aminotransferase family protein [uncultured Sulfurovum sp.]|uniref:Alanine--glyoxylate aminotransferase family protein n=1 Tax=uncultured Sulfurovum sp. TaxID=269237 RepID=A0A6S6T8L5_9BACT|nr:MAG: Alanine--glyoxylate aminotransferase family protein [uncultured Sulfurovum sp.]
MHEQLNSAIDDLYFNPSLPRLSQKINEIDLQSLVPHRTEVYLETMKKVDALLLKILGNERFTPILLSGNGTLANEIMVANLMLLSKNPAVIVNGEFGQRLFNQALKYNANTVAIDFGFANCINFDTLQKKLKNVDTLFFVALETSTGMMNSVKEICMICKKLDIKIGIDAISAMGAEQVDFTSKQISYITTSSGKNLASISGIAIIFVRNSIMTKKNSNLPTAIDMAYLLESKSSLGLVKNTLSYFLVQSLYISLNELIHTVGLSKHYQQYIIFREMIILEMKKMNIDILENCNASNILSFYYPDKHRWKVIKQVLGKYAICVYDEAFYLKEQNIFQIAYMGFYSKDEIQKLLYVFRIANTEKDRHKIISSSV